MWQTLEVQLSFGVFHSIDEAFSMVTQAFRSGQIPRDEMIRCRHDSGGIVAMNRIRHSLPVSSNSTVVLFEEEACCLMISRKLDRKL